MPFPARARGALFGLLLLATLAPAPAARAGVAVPRDWRDADALAAQVPGRDRDRALERWASRASLSELMFVLRRPPAQLGSAEPALVRRALDRAHRDRRALRRRLILRAALATPRDAGRWVGRLSDDLQGLHDHPRASVFRIAALLPDSGNYRVYGAAVRLGLRIAVETSNASGALPITLVERPTGDDQPARAAAALATAADSDGAAVGELLSLPTLALATGARMSGMPLISPTATDEAVGLTGPTVFQVGPSGFQRGKVLARSVLAGRHRKVGLLVSSAELNGALVRGFAAAAESLGSTVVMRESYAPGSRDFRSEARRIGRLGVEVLFWDGEGGEADALVKDLARERVKVQLCGNDALDPDQHHSEARALLEGARFVGPDWELSPPGEAWLDSLVRARGAARVHALHVRGYLAGRFLCAAVRGGALCPEEIVRFLTAWSDDTPYLEAHGFLDCTSQGARIPVFRIYHGRAEELPRD